jgi:hypothetical protein
MATRSRLKNGRRFARLWPFEERRRFARLSRRAGKSLLTSGFQ